MKTKRTMISFWKNYRHALPLILYGIVYMQWFSHLEKTVTSNYRLIHFRPDDFIPFCEAFVIPYLLWFAYVAAVVVYFFFRDKDDYFRACTFLFTGMTVFLIVSTLWPNGHDLRPAVMPRDNICTRLVSSLYHADTPTNLWPSIHVYNSMGAHFALTHSALGRKKSMRIASGILALSIILSTMLIKQHSVFDVVTGIGLGSVMYLLVYKRESLLSPRAQRKKGERTPQAS